MNCNLEVELIPIIHRGVRNCGEGDQRGFREESVEVLQQTCGYKNHMDKIGGGSKISISTTSSSGSVKIEFECLNALLLECMNA